MTTTVYVTVFTVPLNKGETGLTPEAVLATDGQRLEVIGDSNTAHGLASLARRHCVPGGPEEALWQFCRHALSSYEPLGELIHAEKSLDTVVQQMREVQQLA